MQDRRAYNTGGLSRGAENDEDEVERLRKLVKFYEKGRQELVQMVGIAVQNNPELTTLMPKELVEG